MGKLVKLLTIKIIIIVIIIIINNKIIRKIIIITIIITKTAIKEIKITIIPGIREIIITPDITSKRIIIPKLIIS